MDPEECCVPPGFRFHPTEEELVGYYLARKVAAQSIDLDIIQELDLYRMEPWDLLLSTINKQQQQQGGSGNGGDEWYFFSHKDRKYPSGTRTNRATAAGFWKATGRDKPVLSSSSRSSAAGTSSRISRVIGMRKTLVFYKGRAPNGRKTDWIMHEYRLLHSSSSDHDHDHQQEEEGWVVCRAFRKPIPNQQQQQRPGPSLLLPYHHHHPSNLNLHSSSTAGLYGGFFLGSTASPLPPLLYPPRDETRGQQLLYSSTNNPPEADDDHLFLESKINNKQQHLLLSIPQLIHAAAVDDDEQQHQQQQGGGGGQQAEAAIDWKFLDTLLLSSTTLLHDDPVSFASPYLQLQ